MRFFFLGLIAVSVCVVSRTSFTTPEAMAVDLEKASTYNKDVLPILESNCFSCHNAKKKKAGIDLQSGFAGVQKIVKPSSPDDSKLFKCLIGKGAKLMPPKSPLDEKQIATVKAWIAAGAKEK